MENSRVRTDAPKAYRNHWYVVPPIRENKRKRDDLERNNNNLKEKEVPPNAKAKGIIYPMTGKSYKATRDRHVRVHFGHAVVYKGNEDILDDKSKKKAPWPGPVQGSTYAQEEGCPYRCTKTNNLERTIIELALQIVRVAGRRVLVLYFERLAETSIAFVGRLGFGNIICHSGGQRSYS